MMDVWEQEKSGVIKFWNMDEVEIETAIQKSLQDRLNWIAWKREAIEVLISKEKAAVKIQARGRAVNAQKIGEERKKISIAKSNLE